MGKINWDKVNQIKKEWENNGNTPVYTPNEDTTPEYIKRLVETSRGEINNNIPQSAPQTSPNVYLEQIRNLQNQRAQTLQRDTQKPKTTTNAISRYTPPLTYNQQLENEYRLVEPDYNIDANIQSAKDYVTLAQARKTAALQTQTNNAPTIRNILNASYSGVDQINYQSLQERNENAKQASWNQYLYNMINTEAPEAVEQLQLQNPNINQNTYAMNPQAFNQLQADVSAMFTDYDRLKLDEINTFLDYDRLIGGTTKVDEDIQSLQAWQDMRAQGYTDKEILDLAQIRKREVSAQQQSRRTQAVNEYMDEGGRITANLATIANVPIRLIGQIGQLFDADKSEYSLDPNAMYFMVNNFNEDVRSRTAQEIEQRYGGTKGAVLSFLYQTAMSGADSLMAAYTGSKINLPVFNIGGKTIDLSNVNLGGVILGADAATSTAKDLLSRGANLNQVMAGSLMAGVFESLFESVSIGQLDVFKTNDRAVVTSLTDALKKLASSGVVNMSEEALTEIANIAFDRANMGNKSNAAMLVESYIDAGYSEEEAKKLASQDLAKQVLEAGLSGLLMGVAFGGIDSASSFINIRSNLSSEVLKQINGLSAKDKIAVINEAYNSDIGKIDEEKTRQLIDEVRLRDKTIEAFGEGAQADFALSATRYNIDPKDENVISVGKIITNRGINARFDENVFGDSNIAGLWTSTTDENGNVIRSVIFNPNATSEQWLQDIAIHELWHDMTGTKTANEISNLITSYNLTKSEYETARKALEAEYAKVYDVQAEDFNKRVDEEAVASVLGKKLGTQEFINEIINSKPTVARRIYNWVVDKLNKITGYSNEKIFWQDIKNKFDQAYRKDYAGKNADTRYYISYDVNNTPYVVIEDDILKGVNKKDILNTVVNTIKTKFGNGIITVGGEKINVTSKSANEYTRSKTTDYYRKYKDDIFKDKMKSSNNLDEIVWASRNYVNEDIKHRRTDGITSFGRGKVQLVIGDNEYMASVLIGNREDNSLIFYDILDMNPINIEKRSLSSRQNPYGKAKTSSENTIPQPQTEVNSNSQQYSMQNAQNNTQNNSIAPTGAFKEYLDTNFTPDGTGVSIAQLRGQAPQAVQTEATQRAIQTETAEQNQTQRNAKIKSDVLPKVDYKAIETDIKQAKIKPPADVSTIFDEPKKEKKTVKQKLSEAKEAAKQTASEVRDVAGRKLLDSGYTLARSEPDIAKNTAYLAFESAKSAPAKTANNIGVQIGKTKPKFDGFMTDMLGNKVSDSITELLYPLRENEEAFNLATRYFAHYRNIESIDNKGIPAIEGLTRQESQAFIDNYETMYPEYSRRLRETVKTITDNIQNLAVQAGLRTQEQADLFAQIYSVYAPLYREVEGANLDTYVDILEANVNKRAFTSNEKIMNLEKSLITYFSQVMRQANINQYSNALISQALNNPKLREHIEFIAVEENASGKTPAQLKDNEAQNPFVHIAYNGDAAVVFKVDTSIQETFKELSGAKSEIENYLKFWADLNNGYRGLLTTKNPLFIIRNMFRDAQEVLINSPDLKGFINSIGPAFKAMQNNDKMFQDFIADGIMSAGFNLDSEGKIGKPKNKVLTSIENANEIVEMLPRFIEYYRTRKQQGNSFNARLEAAYNAKEITTNFGRHGQIVKYLNRYGFNFLNAGVQGAYKLSRNFTRSTATLILKAALLGFLPKALGELMYRDDEDYNNLSASTRANYYLIKIGNDGRFIRIPVGRVLAAARTIATGASDAIKGKDVNFSDLLKNMLEQTAPANPLTSNIVSPLIQAVRNETWYGSAIVNATLEQKPSEEQYDETTDLLSKYLGQIFKLSPKKVSYVLDQYTGVIGDFLLPIMQPRNQGFGLSFVFSPAVNAFVTDSITSNDISDRFYNRVNEVNTNLASNNPTPGYELIDRFLLTQSNEVSELWKQINEIQTDTSISLKERNKQIRDIRKIINGIQLNAINQYDELIQYASEYSGITDNTKTDYMFFARDLFGSEYALETYNQSVYEQAQLANACGIDYDTYFDFYVNTVDLNALNESGETVNGLRKQRVYDEIWDMDISEGEKAFLFASEYSLSKSNDYYNYYDLATILRDYINGLPLSKEDKETLFLEFNCFELNGGKVYIK